MRISLIFPLVALTIAIDGSAAHFIKTPSKTLLVSTNSPVKGSVEITVKGSREKSRVLSTHRFEVNTSGDVRELAQCGIPASDPVCMEIILGDDRYYFPSFQSLYLGKDRPRIWHAKKGEKVPLDLPMSAGSIHSIEVTDTELKVTVFAQEALGQRQENGRVMYGISHDGTFKTVIFRDGETVKTSILQKEPKP